MKKNAIQLIKPLGFTWETQDPFLFCVHHLDHYPPGNEKMGPKASLQGRNLGQDFTVKDGWRMYHGETIPGFPAHPHRGFETVTVVLQGYVDHSDSHGAAGRYGNGDVQWMTAGSGLQHSEMFPLIHEEKPNPLELFQIWLNLPKSKKFSPPHFSMLWSENIPVIKEIDDQKRQIEITLIAGNYKHHLAQKPAPDSWAADSKNNVGIWLIKLDAYAEWNLPHTSELIHRSLYFYRGNKLFINDTTINFYHSVQLLSEEDVLIKNGSEEAFILIRQGKPIAEPIVQYGPFVMNRPEEIQQAFLDYRKTQFGGWPWKENEQVHPKHVGRFAKYANGNEEIK